MDHTSFCREGGFQGCSRDKQRNDWRCARAVPELCENAPSRRGHHRAEACIQDFLLLPIALCLSVDSRATHPPDCPFVFQANPPVRMVSIHPCDDGALPSTEEGDRAGFDPLPEAVCSSPRSQSLQTEVLPSFSTHDTCNTLGPAKPGGFVTPRKFPAIRAMAVAEGLRVLASRLQVPTRRDMYTPNLLSPLGHHSMPFARPQPWSVLLCAALVLLHVVACLVLLHIGESRYLYAPVVCDSPSHVPPPLCPSHALVQATVGIGTALIWDLI